MDTYLFVETTHGHRALETVISKYEISGLTLEEAFKHIFLDRVYDCLEYFEDEIQGCLEPGYTSGENKENISLTYDGKDNSFLLIKV